MRTLMMAALNKNLDKVLDFVRDFFDDLGFKPKQIMQVCIAVEEVYINVSSYAYNPDIGPVTINCHADNNKAVIEFIDSGKPYNPLDRPDPDIRQSADERDIGGLGVFMVKHLMDSITYRYEQGKNILIIEKNI